MVITIFVRHSADCKYRGDEFEKRCRCRKHFRWSHGGKQFRQKANTRSWEEAERHKRILEDRLEGRVPVSTTSNRLTIADARDKFMTAKNNDGLEQSTLDSLRKTVDRIVEFSAADNLIFLDEVDLTHV